MYQLIYSSCATAEFTIDDLTYLIEQARKKNMQLDITGLLLFYNRYFFQILEGDKSTLDALYLTIAHDKRHLNVNLINLRSIQTRAFAHWRLGIANFPKQLPIITPDDFFAKNLQFTLSDKACLDPLIHSFSKGLNQCYVQI